MRRVKESRFRKSSPRKCKKGVDRWYAGSTSTYNGGVSASSGTSEDQRARETKRARARDRDEVSEPEVDRSESERSRKHRRYPIIAPWRVRKGA